MEGLVGVWGSRIVGDQRYGGGLGWWEWRVGGSEGFSGVWRWFS